MESKQINFKAALAFGAEAEHEIANCFLSASFTILPLYQFNPDSAPKLFTISGSIIAPDLTVMKNRKVYFIEVKRKTRWIHWNGRLETGLNARLYEQYKKLSDLTGIECFIFFKHEEETPHGIYWTSINNTSSRYWNGYTSDGFYVNPPEMFFQSESLRRFYYP